MVSMESRLNSSGTFSKDSQRCKSVIKIVDLLSSMGQTPESCTGRILFMSMFNDIFCDRYDNKDECLRNANNLKTFAGRFGIGQWSFIGPGSERKWYSAENTPRGAWDNIEEKMLVGIRRMRTSYFHGKQSIHFAAEEIKIETIFRIILCPSAQYLRSSGGFT